MLYREAVTRVNLSSIGIAISDDLIHRENAVFPIIKGHDAEVIQINEKTWHIYYAPNAFFDMPGCDIRLVMFIDKLSELFEKCKKYYLKNHLGIS